MEKDYDDKRLLEDDILEDVNGGKIPPKALAGTAAAITALSALSFGAMNTKAYDQGWDSYYSGSSSSSYSNSSVSVPSGIKTTYRRNKTLAEVALPSGWRWSCPSTTIFAGNRAYKADYISPDGRTANNKYNVKINVYVEKATPQVSVPGFSSITYKPNMTLSDIRLPDGWSWNYSGTSVNAGRNTYSANYISNDSNYHNLMNVGITVNVKKAQTVLGNIPSYEITYQEGRTVSDIGLPRGWRWSSDFAYKKLVAGNWICKADYISPNPNYENVYGVDIRVKVNKARPNVSSLGSYRVTYESYKTLSSISLPRGWRWTNPDWKINAGSWTCSAYYAGDENHEASGSVNVSVKVDQAVPTVVTPSLSGLTYSPYTKLSTLSLPSGWVWKDPSVVPQAGNNHYYANYISMDPNYTNLYNIMVPVNVKKANPVVAAPQPLDITYSRLTKLRTLALPNNWEWDDPSIVPQAGSNSYKINYISPDKNYNNIYGVNLKVNVKKAMPVIPTYVEEKYCDDLRLGDIGLPWGWQWHFPNEVLEAGTHTCYMYYTSCDGNYQNLVNVAIRVYVEKAVPKYPTGLSTTYNPNQTLSNINLPRGWTWESPSTVPTPSRGSYKANYTSYNNNYKNLSSVYVDLNVRKARPDGVSFPSVKGRLTYGQRISEAVLSGGLGDGKFVWENPNVCPTVNNSGYKIKFIPTRSDLYLTVDSMVPITVLKNMEPGSAPSAPTVDSTTDTSIVLEASYDKEYSIDGGTTWQSSGRFFGLMPQTQYKVVSRFKDTDNRVASNVSNETFVSTKKVKPEAPSSPLLDYRTNKTIKLKDVPGCEYSIDGGNTWQKSSKFESLSPEKSYRFMMRFAETDDTMASDGSEMINLQTKSTGGYIWERVKGFFGATIEP